MQAVQNIYFETNSSETATNKVELHRLSYHTTPLPIAMKTEPAMTSISEISVSCTKESACSVGWWLMVGAGLF
jgi:hypothetical protein